MKDRIAIITTREPIESDTWIYYSFEKRQFESRYSDYGLLGLIEYIHEADENEFIDYDNLKIAIDDLSIQLDW